MAECITCIRLGRCSEVTPQLLLAHYKCDRWEAVEDVMKVSARTTIVNQFGEAGLRVLINEPEEEG